MALPKGSTIWQASLGIGCVDNDGEEEEEGRSHNDVRVEVELFILLDPRAGLDAQVAVLVEADAESTQRLLHPLRVHRDQAALLVLREPECVIAPRGPIRLDRLAPREIYVP